MTLALGTDILFVLILVTFCVRGADKGFSGEIISLLATIGGFLLAWKLSAVVSSLISPYLSFSAGSDPGRSNLLSSISLSSWQGSTQEGP